MSNWKHFTLYNMFVNLEYIFLTEEYQKDICGFNKNQMPPPWLLKKKLISIINCVFHLTLDCCASLDVWHWGSTKFFTYPSHLVQCNPYPGY